MFYLLLLLMPHFHKIVFTLRDLQLMLIQPLEAKFRILIPQLHIFSPLSSLIYFTTYFIAFYYSVVFSILFPFNPFLSFLHFFTLKRINRHLYSFLYAILPSSSLFLFLFTFPASFIQPSCHHYSLPSFHLFNLKEFSSFLSALLCSIQHFISTYHISLFPLLLSFFLHLT